MVVVGTLLMEEDMEVEVDMGICMLLEEEVVVEGRTLLATREEGMQVDRILRAHQAQ